MIHPSRAATAAVDPVLPSLDAGMPILFTEAEARQLSAGDFNRPLACRQSAGERARAMQQVLGEAVAEPGELPAIP